jgi:biotin carboxylase
MSQELNKQDITRPENSPIVRRPLEETDSYVEEHLDRERTLWQKVFPDKQRRYIELAKRKAVRSHYEHQHQVLQIAHEARLQEIKEIYNDFLVKGKTKFAKNRPSFFKCSLKPW